MKFSSLVYVLPIVPQLARAAACSTDCASEFRTGCFAHQCAWMGKTTAQAIQQCRTELDQQRGPISRKCLASDVGCTLATNDLDCASHTSSPGAGPTAVGGGAGGGGSATPPCKTATGAGTTGASSYGATIRIIGDSCLAGDGVQTELAKQLDTTVTNCAVGGASLSDIFSLQTACSQDANCPQWSVVGGGRNGVGDATVFQNAVGGGATAGDNTLNAMRLLVDREVNAGRKVILFLYPPDRHTPDPTSTINQFQDEFKNQLVDASRGVYMYDPREDPRFNYSDPNSRQYRATDNSHPSELAREEMGKAVATMIQQLTPNAGGITTTTGGGAGGAGGAAAGAGSGAGTGAEEPDESVSAAIASLRRQIDAAGGFLYVVFIALICFVGPFGFLFSEVYFDDA